MGFLQLIVIGCFLYAPSFAVLSERKQYAGISKLEEQLDEIMEDINAMKEAVEEAEEHRLVKKDSETEHIGEKEIEKDIEIETEPSTIQEDVTPSLPKYSALILGDLSPTVLGTLKFTQKQDCMQIAGILSNLTPGKHGFHIHTYGDLSEGCKSAAGHYNPKNVDHAGPKDKVRQVGDLGNIEVGEDGEARVDMCADFGIHSVLGRMVVVHGGVDDLGLGGAPSSKKSGNAGARVGCGVIGIANPAYTENKL